eukprot:GHVU01148582.1.p1 GENE.GHVU01148582.1~~GHVU01148582.1.p1  ORF type:complete len:893 (-),score=104.22 GHVU01148582.1:10-2688(-)
MGVVLTFRFALQAKMYHVLDGLCCPHVFEVIGTPHCRCGCVLTKTHPLIVKLSGMLAEGAIYSGVDWEGLQAGQVEVEDENEVEGEEDDIGDREAAAKFASELSKWHLESFATKEAFNEAVVKLNEATNYSLCVHHTRPPNSTGLACRRYICKTKGCKVSCCVRYHPDGGPAAVTVNHAVHSHPPGGRRRMRRDEKKKIEEVMRAQISVGQGSKRTLAASTTARLVLHEETGHAFSGNAISRVMRRSDKKRRLESIEKAAAGVQAIIGIGEAEVCVEDGMSSVVKATLNILRSLLWADRGAYARVAHDKHRIQYIFFCTGRQRGMGYRFGDLRFLDDKHGSSSQQYHLAACVVINEHGKLEVAAFGYLGSSSCALWNEFVSDCRVAFEGEDGSTLREWKLTIVDQDAALGSAVRMINSVEGSYVWHCFFHFVRNIKKKHGKMSGAYEPIHKLFEKLLYNAVEDITEIITEIEGLLDEFPLCEKSLVDKERAFLTELVDAERCLSRVPAFSNGYTSQSPAESAFAVCSALDVSSANFVPEVVLKLLNYSFAKQAECEASQPAKPARHHEVLAGSAKIITGHAFDLLCEQHDQAGCYDVANVRDGVFVVTRCGRQEVDHELCRTVTVAEWHCSCNYDTYMGLPCRHILATFYKLHGHYVHVEKMFNSRWNRVQPHFSPKNECTLISMNAGDCDVDDADDDDDDDCDFDCDVDAAMYMMLDGRKVRLPQGVVDDARLWASVTKAPRVMKRLPAVRVESLSTSKPRPDTPAEHQSDVFMSMTGVLSRVGHNKPMLDKLSSGIEQLENDLFGGNDADELNALDFQAASQRGGQQRLLRLKRSAVKYRSNSSRQKPKASVQKSSRCAPISTAADVPRLNGSGSSSSSGNVVAHIERSQ